MPEHTGLAKKHADPALTASLGSSLSRCLVSVLSSLHGKFAFRSKTHLQAHTFSIGLAYEAAGNSCVV